MKLNKWSVCIVGITISGAVFASTYGFDSKNTGPNNYYRPTTHGSHDWTDGGANFNLSVATNAWGSTWAGFTYSDVNNTTTPGFGNEYAVYGDGRDYTDIGVYAVGYASAYSAAPTLSFGSAQTVNGFYANNTTYAALDMINGSGFSKAFSTNDWFKLTVEGFNGSAVSQGSVDFLLADFSGYSSGDNKEDYMVTDWTWVDLTSLGSDIFSVEFSLSSSDIGAFGMNTPSYFAADNFEAVPEPASIALVLASAVGLIGIRRYMI